MGASLIGRGGSLGAHDGRRRRKRELVRAAGELLPVSAVGADGTVVLEDGSLVHVVACAPPNQESMDSEAVEKAFWGFRALAASLERGQVLQLQVEGDLLETGEHMGFYRRQLEARYGLDAAAVHEREALSLPGDLRARWALCRMRGFQAHLARDGVHGRVLNGGELLRYLVSRCNPTSATWGRLESRAGWDGVLSRFDSPVERDEAREVARRLREHVARSPLDFRRSPHHGEVEQDLVRTGFLGGSPSSTRMFWLRELLHQPVPFTLTVFLHGLARSQVQDEMTRAWHQAQRENERRAGRGRRDAEAERQEREQELLVEEMANDPQAGLVELSLYLLLRAPGPRPSVNELEEAAHQAGQTVHRATAGGVLMPGTREQDVLWRSTLPLGLDVAHKALRFGMEHAADTTALIGASCGSPQGLPLLVTPTGEIEYLNPFDRAHRNHSIVVAGTSGTGK